MSKRILYGIFLLFFITSCGGPKEVVKNPGVSSRDYPYIEKFHEGVRLKSTGRVEEAIVAFEECLLMRQDDDAVYFALSELELERNNEPAAALHIVKAAELDPNNVWYTQELAYMYFKREEYPDAVKQFKILTEKEPDNVDWLYGYAESLAESGDIPRAIEALNKTEEQLGLNPRLSLKKYTLYMGANKEEQAVAEIDRARETYPKDAQLIATLVDHYFQKGEIKKATEMLEALVIADPLNGRAQLALADVYRRDGKQEEAYEALKKAFEAPDVDFETKARILININESSFKVDKEVYALVQLVVKQNPTESRAHSIHGDYLLNAERESEALIAYKEALKFDKSLYPIWNQVLVMEYQNGDNDVLYQDSKECLELFPTMLMVYLLNGVSANQTKRYSEALDVLSLGRELIVNDRTMEAEFLGQLGDASFGLKDHEAGKKNYKRAIELDPGSLLLKSNFAYRLAISGKDLDLAESLVKQASDNAPEVSQFVDTYGLVLFQKGQFEAAKVKFIEAQRLNEEDEVVAEHLGDAYFKLNDVTTAIEWWKKAQAMKSTELLDKKINDKTYYAPQP
jgi:tetratricopeptide (TPR) repeat protein